jgi:hypothetical protein
MKKEEIKTLLKQGCLLRFKQESTWRGIVAILALGGVQIAPDQLELIVSAAVSIMASINILKSD